MTRGVAGLKYAYTTATHCRWHLTSPAWHHCVIEASELIEDPSRIPAEMLLKHGHRRLVFRHLNPITKQPVLIKAFPLQGIKRQLLKHRKYAQAEAKNLEQAISMGLPVPALYAFGHRGLLLKRWTAVIMEQAVGRDFSSALNTASTAESKHQVVNRCAELLLTLFRAGVNHIDLKPDALFFGTSPAEDRIIDFQYCNFGAPKLQTAMAQAGHFAYWWLHEDTEAEAMIQDWVHVLITRLCNDTQEQESAYALFNEHRQSVMSIDQRLQQ